MNDNSQRKDKAQLVGAATEKLEAKQAEPTVPFQRSAQLLEDHPAVALTLGYIFISMIGVAYMWGLFRGLGLNVMEFAEANDFLVAAFREPILFVYYSLLGVATSAGYFVGRRTRPSGLAGGEKTEQRRVYRLTVSALVYFLLTVICTGVLVILPAVFGLLAALKIQYGYGATVVVELRSSAEEGIPSCLDGDLFLSYSHTHSSCHVCISAIAR